MNSLRCRSELRRSLVLVTLGGCLAMVFVAGTMCPVQTEFFRAIGATEFHFGIIGGLPMVMVFMNFIGAAIANRIRSRKATFIVMVIASRLLYLPIAFLPLLFPGLGGSTRMNWIVLFIGLSAALGNLVPPLWFSWMADLIPGRILNRYWGVRHYWLQLVWTLSFLLVSVFTYLSDLSPVYAYPILAGIGVFAGVVDILLFLRVEEPPNQLLCNVSLLNALLEPLRHREYRTFLFYMCMWSGSVMCAAAFMQLYVLKVLGVPLWQATLIWCVSGVANALAARYWGRAADRHGSKPVMLICTAFKPLIVLVLIFVSPAFVVPTLLIGFMLDGVWNAGNMVAANGYMLKIAPRENRSMFIASIAGFSGICGGVSAMLGGVFLDRMAGIEIAMFHHTWTNYHLLFGISLLLRIGCALMLNGVREPSSKSPAIVLGEIRGMFPMRFRTFPVGLYRRMKSIPGAPLSIARKVIGRDED